MTDAVRLERRLGAVVLVAGVAAMVTEELGGGASVAHIVTKLVATAACVAFAVLRRPAPSPRYRRLVLAGLGLSFVGDSILALPDEPFVLGLGCFLLVHVVYTVAFGDGTRFAARVAPFLAYGALGGAVYAALWRVLDPTLRIAVAVYVVAVVAMAGQAQARAAVLRTRDAYSAAFGSGLFVVSVCLQAVERFLAPLPYQSFLILSTYWAAQWNIARSVAPIEDDHD
jgi:uncharacterized membrane protein YhhN